MLTELRIICNEIRTLARGLKSATDTCRLRTLAGAVNLVQEAIAGLEWLEASGRATELAARCDQDELPDVHERSYLAQLSEGLVVCLERQLAGGFDAAFMPRSPGTWTFLLLGGLTRTPAFDRLALAGFCVTEVDSLAELAEFNQVVVMVDARWLLANPLPEIASRVIVIALVNQDSQSDRLNALRSGARLLLDQGVSAETVLTALCGLAWQPAQSYRVMIVDDNELLLELNAAILQQAGYTVLAVQDPLSVENLIEKFDPEVLLLDIEMPGCRGTELASLLRQKESRILLPVIYLTGHSEKAHLLAARRAGCDDFLSKPVSPEVLNIAVATAARKYRLTRQLEHARIKERDQLDHLRTAIDVHAIVSIAMRDGTMIYVNERFCQISGYTRAELLGKNHRIVKSDQHPDAFFSDMWRTIYAGHIWQGEICNRRKNGRCYWVNTSIVPVMDATGVPCKFISIRTDITEVKEKGERLRRSQLFANIGTWDWDLERDVLFWSERVGPLFGQAPGVVNISHEQFLSCVHAEDRQALGDQVSLCLEQGSGYNIEYRCVWPDGSLHWLYERGDVVRDGAGVPVHLLGVVQDITQRKLAEFAMAEARDIAESASRAKSEFLASMSHELRTPLNAILGYAQLFSINPRIPPEVKEQTHEIERAGRHLLSLVEDLIDLARIESGKLELLMESVVLKKVIDDSLAMVAPVAKRYGIKLINNIGLSSGHIVHADYVRLRQVFINLLANAIKYNREEGEVRIDCIRHEDVLRISVSDIGPGIPLDKQQRLFTAFDRLGEERGSIEGSGIGLNITRRIVESMGGQIGFVSRPGQGSTFWVDFKFAGMGAITSLAATEALDVPAGEDFLTKRHVVLHVEDNAINQRFMRQVFNMRKNLELREAHSAELGIEMARAAPPALILMDINLPGMDGYTALQVLRADPLTRHIPVIAITANAMKGEEARGIQAGFLTYFTKPLDIKRFLAMVDELTQA